MYVSGKRFMAFMTSTHLYGLTFLEITAKKYVFRQYFIVKVSVMLGNFAVIFFIFTNPQVRLLEFIVVVSSVWFVNNGVGVLQL